MLVFWLLAHLAHDLSAEKKIDAVRAEQMHKTVEVVGRFTQFSHTQRSSLSKLSFCQLLSLYNQLFFSHLEISEGCTVLKKGTKVTC